MLVTLDLNEVVVRKILDFSDEEGVVFEEAAAELLTTAAESKELTLLGSDAIDETVQEMLEHAISDPEVKLNRLFKTPELYNSFMGDQKAWNKLHPSTRKSIGRRFRVAMSEQAEAAAVGDVIIEFKEKNINNAALYSVVIKE